MVKLIYSLTNKEDQALISKSTTRVSGSVVSSWLKYKKESFEIKEASTFSSLYVNLGLN